jgi:hypothetical protein
VAIGIWHGGSMKFLFASGLLQWCYIVVALKVGQHALEALSSGCGSTMSAGGFPGFPGCARV